MAEMALNSGIVVQLQMARVDEWTRHSELTQQGPAYTDIGSSLLIVHIRHQAQHYLP